MDTALRIGGIVPLSFTDYPGCLSAVVFCQGCPWRCAYCHNPHLLPRHGNGAIPWQQVTAFLRQRRGLLDAVVFSGGEPTLQPALAGTIREVKDMGFRVGLHTAGIHPQRLALLLPLVDWVGMDVKTEFHLYAAVTGAPGSGERARLSMELILASGVAHEFRTTVDPDLLTNEALDRLADHLSRRGVRRYALQACRTTGRAPPDTKPAPPAGIPDAALCRELASRFEAFEFRAA